LSAAIIIRKQILLNSGATRLLPRDGVVEELHHGDPTVEPRLKAWTRGQKWTNVSPHQRGGAVPRRPTLLREVGRNGETTTRGVWPSGRPHSSAEQLLQYMQHLVKHSVTFSVAESQQVQFPLGLTSISTTNT